MTQSRHAAQLRDNVLQHLACTRLLLGTLAEERKALVDNDIGDLERIAGVKASAAQMLRDLGLQLAAARTTARAANMEALLEQFADEPLRSDWQQLLQLAARCQRANQENSALLEARHTQVRTALRTLRGQPPPGVYGRSGESLLALAPQRLGAA